MQEVSKMRNPCGCCQSKIRFIRHINGNYMHSMVIPEWVINHFGRNIVGSIKLEAPNGNIYDVGVTVKMNTTFLQSGWRAFVDANQIEENFCLMFRYRGTSRFEVTIFDSNGKEKVPCRDSMGSDSASQSSAGEGSDSTAYSSKELPENNPSLDDSMESDDLQVLSKYYVLSGLCDLTEEQLTKLHALVGKIKPEIPVLVVLMKKSNVNHNFTLIIRKDYAREYFPPKNTTIILQLPGKSKHWNCKFYILPSGESKAGRCDLSIGNFVRDNHVRKGDIFLLQPITKVKGHIFTVTVHPLHKASIDHSPDGSTDIGLNHGCASTKMASTASVKEEPIIDESTKTALTPRVKEEPTIDGEEISFWGHAEHGSSDSSEEDSQPRILLNHGCASTKMALTARVKEERTIDGEEISSSGHGEHVFSDNSNETSEARFMPLDTSCLLRAQEKKMMEKIEAIKSELPIYWKVMNKSDVCVHKRGSPSPVFSSQYISRYLAEKYATGLTGVRGRRGAISLLLERDGRKRRTWSCQLRRSIDRTRIAKGWPSFARDNHLQAGDLCLFEVLRNEEQLKMVVYIIRREEC